MPARAFADGGREIQIALRGVDHRLAAPRADPVTVGEHDLLHGIVEARMFPGRDGAASDQGSLRRRVLVPAAERAGLTGVGFHTPRHPCASMLIESGLS
jgi:hypothetical protein